MRIIPIAALVLFGCQSVVDGTESVEESVDHAPLVVDHLKEIFDQVDGARLTQTMRELSGVVPVVVNGVSITLGERYSATGRKKFRDYWTQTMRNLGLTVNAFHYQAVGHPRAGDNLEAVLPGTSPNSVVVIVHYDSIGPAGRETSNPGADDDMSGMSIQLETARLLVAHRAQLTNTVRFVASDEEELGGLAGARNYATHIKQLAQASGFTLVAAVDDEQTGWNCTVDGLCGDNLFPAYDVFSCGSGGGRSYNFAALGDRLAAITATYSTLKVKRGCIGANSDHFAMWEIGVPAVVFSEHNPFANPHFDQRGGDTFAKIDMAYLTSIARPGITFQASLAGVVQ
jgi:Zn-dependent M28 family amino/carboxypeptidase